MASNVVDRMSGLRSSLAIKAPCLVTTTANITLSGEQTINGVAVVEDDRVLVKDQTSGADNGIYIVSTGAWRRAKDWNGIGDVVTGTMVRVTAGSTYVGSRWVVSTTGTITIGTTSVTIVPEAVEVDLSLSDFIQSGTGAVTRTAIVKMRETVTPEDFGALGDGTTNDAAAIQAALTYLATSGGRLQLGPKTYRVDSTLTVASNAISIDGVVRGQNGVKGSEIRAETGDFTIISVDGNAWANFTMSNVTVGIKSGVTPTAGIALHLVDSVYAIVENCRFNRVFNGIHADGTNVLSLCNVVVHNISGTFGIFVDEQTYAGSNAYMSGVRVFSEATGQTKDYGSGAVSVDHKPGLYAYRFRGASTITMLNSGATKCERGFFFEKDTRGGVDHKSQFIYMFGCDAENNEVAYHFQDYARVRAVACSANGGGETGGETVSGGWWIGGSPSGAGSGGDFVGIGCAAINTKGSGVTVFTGSTNTEMSSWQVLGNSNGASNTYDGLVVSANVNNVRVIGGAYGGSSTDGSPSTTGLQRYGINVAAGTGDGITIIGPDLRGNNTAPMLFAATGENNQVSGITPVAQTIASAATTDVLGAYSDNVNVTGTTTISSFGSMKNRRKFVSFASALTLTYNATTLKTPNASDFAVYAGQTLLVTSDSSGNATVHDLGTLGINGLTATTTPGTNDTLRFYDANLAVERKMTFLNFMKTTGTLLTEDTAPAVDDFLAAYDTSGSAASKISTGKFLGAAGTTQTSLTIASGAITITGAFHRVDTQGAAATDDLDTITGSGSNQMLVLRAANGTRTVVVKDGTGNLQLAGDFSLDNLQDTITLIYDSVIGAWLEVSRSDNGA